MKLDLHYTDPRLVSLYDTDNPRGRDTDFWMGLADEIAAETIVDLGCGTGLLTRELAKLNRVVIGVDPSRPMLDYAQTQPDAGRVNWVVGDASRIGTPAADLVLMTGNVSQVFLEDDDLDETLRHIYGALRPGGYLAFESRNPTAEAWQHWNRTNTYEIVETPFGPLETWLDVIQVANSRVDFQATNIFQESGETLVVDSTLRFRTKDQFVRSLNGAGFKVDKVLCDWDQTPFISDEPMMIFVAQRV